MANTQTRNSGLSVREIAVCRIGSLFAFLFESPCGRRRRPAARFPFPSSSICSIAGASRSSPGRPCASCWPPSKRTRGACGWSNCCSWSCRCLLVLLLVLAMASVTPWAEAVWRWFAPEGARLAGGSSAHAQDPRSRWLVQHGAQGRRAELLRSRPRTLAAQIVPANQRRRRLQRRPHGRAAAAHRAGAVRGCAQGRRRDRRACA